MRSRLRRRKRWIYSRSLMKEDGKGDEKKWGMRKRRRKKKRSRSRNDQK